MSKSKTIVIFGEKFYGPAKELRALRQRIMKLDQEYDKAYAELLAYMAKENTVVDSVKCQDIDNEIDDLIFEAWEISSHSRRARNPYDYYAPKEEKLTPRKAARQRKEEERLRRIDRFMARAVGYNDIPF